MNSSTPVPFLGYGGAVHEHRACMQLLGGGHRAYSPSLMRFHGPDDLSPFGPGGINAFAYCGGDPVNRSDPTGRFSHWVFSGVMVAATGTLGAAAIAWGAGHRRAAGVLAAVGLGIAAAALLVPVARSSVPGGKAVVPIVALPPPALPRAYARPAIPVRTQRQFDLTGGRFSTSGQPGRTMPARPTSTVQRATAGADALDWKKVYFRSLPIPGITPALANPRARGSAAKRARNVRFNDETTVRYFQSSPDEALIRGLLSSS